MMRPDDPGDDRRNALDDELDTEAVVEEAIEYFTAEPGGDDTPAADTDAPPPG
jgi:hypothetical protein